MLRNLTRLNQAIGLKSRSLSTTSQARGKIYELRTYSLVPQKVGEFLALSRDKFDLRTKHSVLLGYWTAELGGLNQVVHLWEYESLSARAEVRAKLGADPEWQSLYFQRILPWLQHQDNLTLTSLTDLAGSCQTSGIYEIWQLSMKNLGWTEQALRTAASLQSDNRRLCGVFKSDFGPMNTAVMVWNHQSIDQSASLKRDLFTSAEGKALWDNVADGQSKLMAATPFSPWK